MIQKNRKNHKNLVRADNDTLIPAIVVGVTEVNSKLLAGNQQKVLLR
jgi:hypothetical protein